jgi:hypothetical protein
MVRKQKHQDTAKTIIKERMVGNVPQEDLASKYPGMSRPAFTGFTPYIEEVTSNGN